MWAFRVFSLILGLWGLFEGRTAVEDGIHYQAAVQAARDTGVVCAASPPVGQWGRTLMFGVAAAISWASSNLLGRLKPVLPDGGGNAVPNVITDLLKWLIEGGLALPVDPPRPDQVTPQPVTPAPAVTPAAEVIRTGIGPVRTELQLVDRLLTTHGLPSRLTLQADVAGQQVSLSLTSHPLVKPAPSNLP